MKNVLLIVLATIQFNLYKNLFINIIVVVTEKIIYN